MKKEMHRLQADTEAIESRLQLAREINAGEANILANLQAEIEGLRQVIQTKRAKSPKQASGRKHRQQASLGETLKGQTEYS